MTTPTDPARSSRLSRSQTTLEAVEPLPDRPNLRYLRDAAKRLVRSGEYDGLVSAQHALARRYGFMSWAVLKSHVEPVQDAQRLVATHDLIDAAGRGDIAAIDRAVKRGAAVRHVYDGGEDYDSFAPPVRAAVEGGHTGAVRRLLELGACDRAWHWDAFEQARALGHDEIAGLLAEHRAREPEMVRAIARGDAECVEALLGVDPTLARSREAGHTPEAPPIVLAAQRGDVRIARRLIQAGADPSARWHNTSFNALTVARYANNRAMVELLESYGVESPRVTDYLYAASRGDVERVRRFLDAGLDVNAKCDCAFHVIVHAFRSSNDELLRLVLDRGADIRQSNGWDGWVWFSPEIEAGDVVAVRRILELGYPVDHRDAAGRTPLWFAKRSGRAKVEALLIEHGATDPGTP
ncbi:MAG: ankyrin repeat domain-containing protein [Planctomycetota bacterium]